MDVGIWTDGIDTENMSGPWLALYRTLSEATFPTQGVTLIHRDASDNELYDRFKEFHVRKNLMGRIRLRSRGFDAVVTNGIPSTVPSCGFHTYPGTSMACWVHGTLPWVYDYAYDDVMISSGKMQEIDQRITKRTMQFAAQRFDVLMANSTFTKRVLVNSVGVDPEQIEVVRYGVSHNIFRPYDRDIVKATLSDLGISGLYVLYVANYHQRKAPEATVRGFARLRDNGFDHNLVIAGSGYEKSPIPQLATDLGVSDNIVYTGFLDESSVAHLYNGCDVFLFPTLHETFGMPILEAMAAGAPVVSSNYTAVPEVAGDAAVLLDNPTDPKAVAEGVQNILTDDELREQMVQDGFERANEFSWAGTATQVGRIIKSL